MLWRAADPLSPEAGAPRAGEKICTNQTPKPIKNNNSGKQIGALPAFEHSGTIPSKVLLVPDKTVQLTFFVLSPKQAKMSVCYIAIGLPGFRPPPLNEPLGFVGLTVHCTDLHTAKVWLRHGTARDVAGIGPVRRPASAWGGGRASGVPRQIGWWNSTMGQPNVLENRI